jgi:hypothetical protein
MRTKFLSEGLKEDTLGRSRRRCGDNTRMDLTEMGWGRFGVDASGSG